jgi:hypothetical protein
MARYSEAQLETAKTLLVRACERFGCTTFLGLKQALAFAYPGIEEEDRRELALEAIFASAGEGKINIRQILVES